MPKTKIIITGGAGFVGHHFVECFLKNTDWQIVIIDKLSYASLGLNRIRDISCYNKKRVKILTADFQSPLPAGVRQEIGGDVVHIFHLGAESHVDRSIANAAPFVLSNVLGTLNMLNYARTLPNLLGFWYFSTDEVFGPAPAGVKYAENDPHNPSNPYAASKSGGEMLVKSAANSWGLPCVITRSMNIIGERQHPEKFVPKVLKACLAGEEVIIHGSPDGRPGSRFYIHARNVADAYLFLLGKLEIKPGECEVFHICGEREINNLELARMVANFAGRELKYKIVDFHSSRPGHDLRYALDDSKIRAFGWKQPKNLEESLKKTVDWTLDNLKWLES